MDRSTRNPRIELARETVVFQLKLLVDGVRDAVLIPVSLIAALIGLFRGGNDCDREYQRVINLGRRSERWINLFGHHRPLDGDPVEGSMDSILEQVETAVMEQYKRGPRTSERPEEEDKNQQP